MWWLARPRRGVGRHESACAEQAGPHGTPRVEALGVLTAGLGGAGVSFECVEALPGVGVARDPPLGPLAKPRDAVLHLSADEGGVAVAEGLPGGHELCPASRATSATAKRALRRSALIRGYGGETGPQRRAGRSPSAESADLTALITRR